VKQMQMAHVRKDTVIDSLRGRLEEACAAAAAEAASQEHERAMELSKRLRREVARKDEMLKAHDGRLEVRLRNTFETPAPPRPRDANTHNTWRRLTRSRHLSSPPPQNMFGNTRCELTYRPTRSRPPASPAKQPTTRAY